MIDVPSPLHRVCVVMMSAVGDAVHVLPVINALKRHSPHIHITWVLQPAPATLVRGHRSVDEILIFDRSKGWAAFSDFGAAQDAVGRAGGGEILQFEQLKQRLSK